jgi:hypothetical protein
MMKSDPNLSTIMKLHTSMFPNDEEVTTIYVGSAASAVEEKTRPDIYISIMAAGHIHGFAEAEHYPWQKPSTFWSCVADAQVPELNCEQRIQYIKNFLEGVAHYYELNNVPTLDEYAVLQQILNNKDDAEEEELDRVTDSLIQSLPATHEHSGVFDRIKNIFQRFVA